MVKKMKNEKYRKQFDSIVLYIVYIENTIFHLKKKIEKLEKDLEDE